MAKEGELIYIGLIMGVFLFFGLFGGIAYNFVKALTGNGFFAYIAGIIVVMILCVKFSS